ncbi:MAG: LiaI-LiaF-like domain-containing protein [Desulfitobacteriia bacterium]|jgi:hypothetical protein
MRKNTTLGIIIILIGIVWLLNNLDFFSFSIVDVFFRALAQLWPLILIGIGFNIVLKENAVLKLLIWLIILVSIFLYGIISNNQTGNYQYQAPNYNYSENHDYSLSKKAATEEGQLNFAFGAGTVQFNSTDTNLMQLKSNVPGLRYDHSFFNDDRKVLIDFNKKNSNLFDNHDNMYCYLDLHQDVTWEMNLDLGATQANLDLTGLAVKNLKLNVGAADLDLRLGTKASQTNFNIDSGASNLKIYVPKEAGLQIKLDSALSSDNLASLGLEKKGDYHTSPDFDNKAVKFIFDIDTGVANVQFQTI